MMRYDKTTSKFHAKYVDCHEGEARAVCVAYPPEISCEDGEDDSGDERPMVDKIINSSPEEQKKRKKFMARREKYYRSLFKKIDMSKSFENVFELLWYSTLPCFPVRDGASSDSPAPDNVMIKKCIWKGERISCAAIFDLFPTDRGMCCTFNMEKAEAIFKETRHSLHCMI